MPTLVEPLDRHSDPAWFRDALTFTAATTGFSAALIEKDYYCSLVLHDLREQVELGFKGGTALAKVHAGFYRMSEDLDFSVGVREGATRAQRSRTIEPLKEHILRLPARCAGFALTRPLRGFNRSTQYAAEIGYTSVVTGDLASIRVEISLREPHEDRLLEASARTLLLDPFSGESAVEAVPVAALGLGETYAEKIRAALTREEPAIRDFHDVDHAAHSRLIDPDDRALHGRVRRKLIVAGRDAGDLPDIDVRVLEDKVETELRPVLRAKDYDAFDIVRAHRTISRIRAALASAER